MKEYRIKREDVFNTIYSLNNEQDFSIKFEKLNGCISEYYNCTMHEPYKPVKGHNNPWAISAKDAHRCHNNLKFFVRDNEINNFRTAKINNIVNFVIGDTMYHVY